MRALRSVLGRVAALALLCTLFAGRAYAAPTVTNPVVLASTVNGIEAGTDNTQFIFRADIVRSGTTATLIQDPLPPLSPLLPLRPRVVIDPFDDAHPENGGHQTVFMVRMPGAGVNTFFAYITGGNIGTFDPPAGSGGNGGGVTHKWSIVASELDNATPPAVTTTASPTPSGSLVVFPSGPSSVSIVPVTPDFGTDVSALGHGLRLDPQDPTAPNNGGGANIYTIRVRATTRGGLPLQYFKKRGNFEWRDPRGDPGFNGLATNDAYNSGVILILTDPNGGVHYCPMEIDPDGPNNGVTQATTYLRDTASSSDLLHPQGSTQWAFNPNGTGVFYRYRILPTQYAVDSLHNAFFGGPTSPDGLPAIQVGAAIAPEVIGRPFRNLYTAFAGPGPISNIYPFETNTAGRTGQWTYRFIATTDFRPPKLGSNPSNGDQATSLALQKIADLYGTDESAYNPGGTGNFGQPYVGVMLSDGGWTDDIKENGFAADASSNSHRSRVTTKTRVRFMVRVTKSNNIPLPLQAVQVYIDDVPHSMQPLNNTDLYANGKRFYFDTTFANPGQVGGHRIYFTANVGDTTFGNFFALWPRRDWGSPGQSQGTGDARFTDTQSLNYQPFSAPIPFGTLNQVGKNYLTEPYVNSRPALSNPQVSPVSGTEGQPFTFSVVYTDPDNDVPLDGFVIVDNQPYRMSVDPSVPQPADYRAGVKYTFTLTLPPTGSSTHTYYFKFRDNWASVLSREVGEWSTLPLGDDNGNPASTFSGPTITSNNNSTLADPGYSFSDPAQTSATFYDFFVKYRDADNQPPANLKFFLSANGGASWDNGTAMVPSESSTNYVTGVLFHLPNRIQLPPGSNYRYKFITSDGVQVAPGTIYVREGTDKPTDGTFHELKPTGNPNEYGDPNGTRINPSTKDWVNAPGFPIFVYFRDALGNYTQTSGYAVNFVNGTITFAAVPTQQVFASYYHLDTIGPTVKTNTAPTLAQIDPTDTTFNGKTISATSGSPTDPFTYSVVYTDADNQAPTYVNVVIDNNRTVPLTVRPGQTQPLDYTRGVKYDTAAVNLGVGAHLYHFEASDGADLARLIPLIPPPPDTEYHGPTITDPSNLTLPLVQPSPKGKSNDSYTFTITYNSPQGSAPPTGGIELRLTPQPTTDQTKWAPGQGVVIAQMNAIDPLDFTKPVRFQVQLTATSTPGLNNLLPGTYQVKFEFTSNPTGTGKFAPDLTVNGRPTLSNATATPNPQSRGGDITVSVKWKDVNGDLPVDANGSTLKLFINNAEYTKTQPVASPGTSSDQAKAGITYTWTVAASDYQPGTYPVRIEASDDLETSPQSPISPTTGTPAGTITINAAALPTLAGPTPNTPATNDGTLTPLKGAFGGTYTYSIVYKHADNVAPQTIQLLIDGGATGGGQTIDLQPKSGQTQPYNYVNGVTYTYTTAAGSLASGAHTYSFTASDRLATVNLPATTGQTLPGPTVNAVPTLASANAAVVGATPSTVNASNALTPAITANTTSKLVFQVTYKDTDFVAGGTAPTVTMTVGTGTPIAMTPVGSSPNYATGAVFTTSAAGITLPPGDQVIHFDATDGLDPARLPATGTISGIHIANIVTLDKVAAITQQDPTGGTVSPLTGPLSQTFTYKVLYMNADGTAPSFVNAILDEATKKVTVPLTPAATGGDFKAGVIYTGTHRFNTGGTHTVHFEAADTVSPTYIGYYPALVPPATTPTPISAPTVNEATFAAATFNPVKPVVSQSVTIGSKLITVPLRATQIAVKLVKPDGTGVNDTTNSASDGTIAYTFTPDQTGDWQIQLSWAGQTGVYDPVMQAFSFSVTGYTVPLANGQLDMIAVPLIPVSPDPTLSFGVTDSNGGNLAVTTLNLIEWSPSLGRYLLLNQDGNFPGVAAGQAYWVKPSQSIVLNPRGRIADQTQPYTIPLNPGWNMIGTVFLQDINWSAVKVRVNGQLLNIADAGQYVRPVAWTYSKSTGGYQMVDLPDGVLSSGRGYWIHATQAVDLILAPPGTRAANVGRATVERSTSLQITVQTGSHTDRDNFAPLNSAANSRLALQEKPPYVGEHVSVHFVTDKVELPADSRAAAAGASNVVVFDVETDKKNADVSVNFPNLGALGRKTDVTLVDLTSNTRRALGTGAGVTYNSGENTAAHRFALIMNTATINTRLVITGLASAGGNSRSPAVSFSYNVSGAATIKAQIVGGAGGQTLRTLDSGRAVPQGTNSLVWDGRDAKGVPVASGSYLLKLTATDEKGHTATGVLPVTVVR